MDETTNQVDVEDTELSTLATDDGVTDDQLLDDGENTAEIPEEEEEVELDKELKLKVPKTVAQKLKELQAGSLMQADYTRKTQELAEERKAFATERETLTKADGEELTARANLTLMDRQLAQYAQVDWSQAFDNDPFEAQKAFAQYQLLQQGKQQAQSFIEQRTRERSEQQQRETATRLQDGAAELARDIPDWSPELSRTLQDFGAKTFNLSKDDFDGITDPRAVKLLYWAHKGHQAEQAATKAQAIQRQQGVTPAINTGGKGQFTPGITDELPIGEYIRRRNAQEAKAKR